MARTDTDIAVIRRVSRQGTNQAPTNIEVEMEWKDAAGVSKGVSTVSFMDLAELRGFLDMQDISDVQRAVLNQTIDKNDGSFRRVNFDAMAGKTFQINQRVVQI